MTVWYHSSTIFNRRRVLLLAMYVMFVIAFIMMQVLAPAAQAAASTNRTITFQGRLLSSAGAVVTDGNYNLQFKIYEGGDGLTANNTGGTLKWTESYTNAGPNGGIQVKNGFFSAKLGSKTTFGSSVDWSAGNLWLSMNIAGSNANCSTFGGANCAADGEMLPMKQISAVPYALSAGSLGGKTAAEFLQLAQGVQEDASTNTASIAVNKTGTGPIMQLQNAGSDVFTVSNAGNLMFGSASNKSISIGTATSGTQGKQLSISAGDGGSGSGTNGGTLTLQGGNAGGTNGNGGNIAIDSGTGTGTGVGGSVSIGTTNATGVTIGRVGATTTIDGNLQTNGIDTKSAGALQLGSTNATSINLNQNVTIATGKSFSVQGITTVKSTTDSNSAFQIQNSTSASVLNVSTLTGGNILTLGGGTGGAGHVSSAARGSSGTNSTSVTSQTTPLLTSVPAGRTLIGTLTTEYGSNLPALTITDSKGNTYTVDSTASHSSTANQYIFSSHITNSLTTSDTITMQFPTTAIRWAWNIEQFDNIVSTNRLDAISGSNGTSNANMSSGATPATTDANELVFGSFGFASPAIRVITPGSGFSSSGIQGTNAGSSNRGNVALWKYVSQTGPQTATATNNAALTWAGAVATYRTTGERGLAGSIGFSDASGFTGSLNVTRLSANRAYTLPDEDGTLCIQGSSNCGFMQSTDQLGIDTTNKRINVGKSDTTGTLLVLDTKTDTGDPTGVNGAMYYNSNANKFRCYENGAWKDCITPLPVSATASADTSNSTTTPSDVTGLSFNTAANTKYYYKFVIQHQSAATSTGIGFGVTTPASPASSNWCVNTTSILANSASNGSFGSYCGTGDASATTSTVQTSNTTYTSTLEGYIQTSATAGTLKLRMKSSAAAQTTVKQGSFGILQVVQ